MGIPGSYRSPRWPFLPAGVVPSLPSRLETLYSFCRPLVQFRSAAELVPVLDEVQLLSLTHHGLSYVWAGLERGLRHRKGIMLPPKNLP